VLAPNVSTVANCDMDTVSSREWRLRHGSIGLSETPYGLSFFSVVLYSADIIGTDAIIYRPPSSSAIGEPRLL